MKQVLLGAGAAGVMGIFASAANAGPLSGSFAVTIWNQTQGTEQSNNPNQQALPTNPIALTTPLATGTYVGNMDFNDSGPAVSIGHFFSTATGQISDPFTTLTQTISTGNFQTETLMKFTFYVPHAVTGTVTHDDGVSIFVAGNTTTDLLNIADSAPTTAAPTESFTLAGGKTYDLWYEASNGLPEDLTFSVTAVPEPATYATFAVGLLALTGIGFTAARRRG